MRLPASVSALLFCVSAHADATDGRPIMPQAASQDGGSSSAERTATSPDAERADLAVAQNGNPLRSIPLRDLKATRERPLFSATRREAAANVPTPQSSIAAAPQEPSPVAVAKTPPFTLVGIVSSGNAGFAILMNNTTNGVVRLHEGQEEAGWTARHIGIREIVLQMGGTESKLELPKPAIALVGAQSAARAGR